MGAKFIDRTGQRFGQLVIVESFRRDGATWVRVRCDCGTVAERRLNGIRQGTVKSCGCLRRTYRRDRWLRHGEAVPGRESVEYRTWSGMLRRCSSLDPQKRRVYADRGITVCAEWRASFEAFLASVGRRPGPGYSIDRIDNNGNYEPGNVRWATASEQARNRRPRNGGADTSTVPDRSA